MNSVSSSTSNLAAGTPTLGAQGIGGGAYPSVSANVLFWKNIGVQGEVAWRAKQNLYQGAQPYRTIFYDFNGIWAPRYKRIGPELMGGIGAESNRLYTGNYQCSGFSGTCTNYVSSNHLAGHIGGGVKLYVTHSIFLRPEGHMYFIRNNSEFADNKAYRVGVSVGYSFGGSESTY